MPAAPPERILIRGVNWLGDAVMTTPALQRLREARPNARITLLTPAKLAGIWQNHPAIDEAQTFAENESAWSVGRRLRSQKFELGLALPNSPRSALELWLAGIPQRVGYARPWRNFFLTQTVLARAGAVAMRKRSAVEINRLIHGGDALRATAYPPGAHHIYQYLHLTAALGAKPEALPPKLVVTEADVARFVAKFKLPTEGSHVWFGLNAGAEYGPAKRWPEPRFIEAAIEIQRRMPCRWLIFGLDSERESAGRIAAAIQRAAGAKENETVAVNLAGKTSLSEFCAALKLCRALLTNDSGPMHVAAAIGIPVVALFGSTSPELTGPGLSGDSRHALLRAEAVCSPCFLRECPIDFRCMNGIDAGQAVEAMLRVSSRG